jgi:stage V sporulation protein B
MSESSRKQNFLQGTALLAMATAIVKVIGAIYKIPLNAIIGKQGFSYYSTAYEIYNVLLMISTAGLPVAMSRMISQASSLGHNNRIRRIYKTSRAIFLALGITGSLLMTLFCRQLAAFHVCAVFFSGAFYGCFGVVYAVQLAVWYQRRQAL